MKRTWLAILATIAALVGVNVAVAQAPSGSFLQTTPSGQSYLMVPNGSVTQPASYHSGPETDNQSCNIDCDDCFVGWTHQFYAYGGLMYLRARDSEVAYAVGVNSNSLPAGGIQTSAVAVVDQDYQPGFFVGFGATLDECSSIGVQYMQFESSTSNALSQNPNITAPFVINSLVVHPGTISSPESGLDANARYDIRFNIADIEYRGLINGDCSSKFNYLVGVRIAQSEQQFVSNLSTNQNNNHTVATDLDFYGAGIKLGLEYERVSQRGLLVYGRSNVSFVPGEFRANYTQTSSLGGPLVNTAWTGGRLVTMADIEIGAGWSNACGTLRVTAGYNIQAWFNTVQTDEWIHGVQTNNYIGMSSMQSFDGLMARVEARF